ncbi:MAG TPA: EVE domain-containing protein [Chryseosolibacter sp.]|nr:EVE domain-containing protein [Chryseosolibacter sp.]
MNYWLVKTEPETYSFDDLVKDKKTVWDGVRNFQARSNLKKMEKGDLVFVYHTGDEKSVAGLARVTKAGYPEPKDNEWIAVDLAPEKKLKKPVSLAQIKSDKRLSGMVLVRAARLSVQPVTESEFGLVMELSEGK